MSGTAVNGSGSPLTMEPDADALAPAEQTLGAGTIVGESMDGEDEHEISDDGPDLTADDSEPDVYTVGDLSPNDIAAGLQNLSAGLATAQDVENAARAEEGLPPLEAAGLLDFGPFNSDAALKAIFEKSAEVRVLQADYDRAKEAAKDAKSELDIASKALVNIIESLKNRRTQALNPTQPYLADVSSDAPAVSPCPWEREHPGQSCPICQQAKAKLINVDVNSEVHPEHAGHADIAEAARVKNVLIPLSESLDTVNVFITPEELQALGTDDLNALQAYADEPTPMPPHIAVRCCLAAEPGSLVQVCSRCDRTLTTEVENELKNLDWHPLGALVGLSCGAYVAPAAEPSTVEAAASEPPAVEDAPRKPRSHAKKNRARKVVPEVERKAQAEEGRGRSISKQESARKGTGKAKTAKAAKRSKR